MGGVVRGMLLARPQPTPAGNCGCGGRRGTADREEQLCHLTVLKSSFGPLVDRIYIPAEHFNSVPQMYI